MKLLSVFKVIGSAAAMFITVYASIMLIACIVSWPEPFIMGPDGKIISCMFSFFTTLFGMFYMYSSEE